MDKTGNPLATLLIGFLLPRVLSSCVLTRLVISDRLSTVTVPTPSLGARPDTPPMAGRAAGGQL